MDMFKIQDFLDIMKAGVVIDIRSGSSKHTSLFASHVSRFRGNLTWILHDLLSFFLTKIISWKHLSRVPNEK